MHDRQKRMHLDRKSTVWSGQEDVATRAEQLLETEALLCSAAYMLQHRTGENDIEVGVGERHRPVRLDPHKSGAGEDHLEGHTILDRGHGDVSAVRIPALQKIRVGKAGVRCYAKIEQTPAWLHPGEPDEARIDTTTGVKRDARGKAAQWTWEVKVINRVGWHEAAALSFGASTIRPSGSRSRHRSRRRGKTPRPQSVSPRSGNSSRSVWVVFGL